MGSISPQRLLLLLPVLILSINLALYAPIAIAQPSMNGAWSFLDASSKEVKVLGEEVGSKQGQSFAGWYTDTVVVDPDSRTIVVAWARSKADGTNDYIYLAFLKPVDADGDGKPEAYRKIIRYVDKGRNVTLDSLTLGTINSKKYVLLTWTYHRDNTHRNDVKGAVYNIDGVFQWKDTIRGTESYEEYSRSCYVPAYNGGRGGFLIIWYTSYDKSIDGRWLYYDGEWKLSDKIDIAGTNNLFYEYADQMLCIGGNSKALVVYRKWDGSEGKPDLYAALVNTSNNIKEVKLWDYNGVEETVGVRGAYTNGYFLVPLLSGTYVRYDVVRESDGYVWHRDYVTSSGEHPYAIALSDRFVLAWIDRYNDGDGEPKVANIDLNDFYIHPRYGVSITGGDTYTDKHPLIAYSPTDNRLLYVWSSERGDGYDIEYAVVRLNGPTDSPKVVSVGTLISGISNQVAHGLGLTSLNQFVTAYTDTSDGEEDLMTYIAFPDIGYIEAIKVFQLPKDSNEFVSELVDIIRNARDRAHVVVAYWDLDVTGKEILDAVSYARNNGVDAGVVLDNSTRNSDVEEELKSRKIPFINDSRATDPNHIMHEKFVVIDNNLVVLTANFGNEMMHDNNTAIVFRDAPTLTYFFDEEFKQLMGGYFGTSKNYDFSFIALMKEPDIGLVIIEGYFSPTNYGMRDKIPSIILGYINRTRAGVIGFTSYIFTTSGYVYPIYKAIVAKRDEAKIYAVFDEGMNLDVPGRIIYWFADNGTPVRVDTHKFRVHSKLFVMFDDVNNYYVSILGSWNPTRTGTVNNDENVIVVRELVDNPAYAKVSGELLFNYIIPLFNKANSISDRYKPPHPVISRVMFKPDNTGSPKYEWVEIYNPTSSDVDLSNYVIGDSENLLVGDDEGLYKFPSSAIIRANSRIIVAYNATAFYDVYGFYPDYEIVDSNNTIPDLKPYDLSRFTDSWSLDDSGDEVILAVDEEGFLRVVDAIWYGSSDYMKTWRGRPQSANPLDTSSWGPGYGIEDKAYDLGDGKWDAVRMNDKYKLVNLSNTPSRAVILLASGKTLEARPIDYDPLGASLKELIIGDYSTSSGSVNLSEIGLGEGIHSVEVHVRDHTPIGDGLWLFSYRRSLGVVRDTRGSPIYLLTDNGSLERILYDYSMIDLHRIIVEGILGKGYVNFTLPELWIPSSIEAYADGENITSRLSVDNGRKLVMINLPSQVNNLTIVARTPENKRPILKASLVSTSYLGIEISDPDGLSLEAYIYRNGTEVYHGSSESGRIYYKVPLPGVQDTTYNITVVYTEQAPSYVNITYSRTFFVRVVPGVTTILSNGSKIISYRIIRINATIEKLEVIIDGRKSLVELVKPSYWATIKAIYLNGVILPQDKWSLSNNVIRIDPPGDDNITLLGGLPTPPVTVAKAAAPLVLGGYGEPYNLIPLITILVLPIAISVVLHLLKQRKTG